MTGFRGRPGFTGPQGLKGESCIKNIMNYTKPSCCLSLSMKTLKCVGGAGEGRGL